MTDDITRVLDRTAAPARRGFRAEVRARMEQEWREPTTEVELHAPVIARRRTALWAACAAASIVALAGAAFALTRPTSPSVSDDDTPASLVDATTASTSDVTTPSSVEPPTTTLPTELSDPALAAWIERQLAAGRTSAFVQPGTATTASLVVAYLDTDPNDRQAVVRLDDGSIVELPEGASPAARIGELVGLGDDVALVSDGDDQLRMWVLDAVDRTWTAGPDLGLGTISTQQFPDIGNVDRSVLIGLNLWADRGDSKYAPTERRGVLVSPDLRVTRVAAPPDGIPLSWTVTSGPYALLLGIDSAADANDPLRQPWSYDSTTNSWTEVPSPPWLDCPAGGCNWGTAHESGDPELEVATPHGVVKRVPDGTIGVYEPSTQTWTQLDPPGFEPAIPATAAVGDLVVVAPMRSFSAPEEFGTVGVLDVPSGTWTTARLDIGAATDSFYTWDLRTTGTTVMLAPSDGIVVPGEPSYALDVATRTWRPPTIEEAARWRSLPTHSGGTVPTETLLG